jgi:hypothetical protein
VEPSHPIVEPDFLAGVIEGFYGAPWSYSERLQLFDWMSEWRLNTYLYAPKDDLKHRAHWRDLYSEEEAQNLHQVIRACKSRGIRFVYALSPGLDLRYSDGTELDCIERRISQMQHVGARDFALLFDDIPDHLDAQDLAAWGSLAAAQAHVANSIFKRVQQADAGARFFFCPTPYCGRMAQRKLGGEGYLATLGRELAPEIDVFWTGPEIISPEITVAHIQELEQLLQRQPILWDNLHANDYDGRRFFCGPYAGRAPELRSAVRGVLTNPNCEFPLNYVPIRTLADFVHSSPPWDARQAFLSAMTEWSRRFSTQTASIPLPDLILLAECYYLPHAQGPGAEAFFQAVRQLLQTRPAEWKAEALEVAGTARRLREVCSRLAELRDRPLFHALSRRIWELREELDLLEKYITFKVAHPEENARFHSDFHLPGTYRGGFVAQLQQLLVPRPDGSFTAAPEEGPGTSA